jgi:uncharacterized RDD family membrane protein YckC
LMSEVSARIMVQAFAMPGRALKTEIVLAGFWRRLVAYVIDSVLLGAIGALLASAVIALTHSDFQTLANVGPVTAAIAWAYCAVMESSPAQATLGKLALNLYVTDTHGDPITFRRAAIRHILKTLSTVVLFMGWVMAAFTPRKQALHDVLAGTLVLRKVHYVVIGPEPPAEPGDHWDGAGWVASVPPLEIS